MWLYNQKYPGTFGLSCNARARTMPQIRWMEKAGVKSVVILMCDIDYNHDVEKMVRARWDVPHSPVKLLDIIYYPFQQTQITDELTKAVGMKPDFLWSEEWSPQLAVSMMKALHDLSFKGSVSVTADLTQEDVDSVPAEFSEGVYSHMDFAPDATIPANKAFTDYWQTKFGAGKLPWRSEEVIWAQTVFFLKAMDKAGTAGDQTAAGLTKIHDAMHQLQWTGPTGDLVHLSAPGLGLLPRTPLAQVKGGKIEVIEYLSMTPNDWLPQLPDSWTALKT
jgi:ABC-type branched-subunit amino acid transport system substrate-binding protein